MPRKMIMKKDGSLRLLTEALANGEVDLQELVKETPDILPFEEYGLIGPLMVVGRETTLPSGAVDLVGLARSGDVLIVEFKTGPQNSDFRAALAQLLDYGSDLWGMSYDEFESTVAVRYFASDRCEDPKVRGKKSLADAQSHLWPEMNAEEGIRFKDRLSRQLESGAFHFLLVASRFTKTVERTIDYMNYIHSTARFYAIELIPFAGDGLSAYEARTLVKPAGQGTRRTLSGPDEVQFLAGIADEEYRDSIHDLFNVCNGLGLRFEWGASGASIRLPTADSVEPISVAWVFPPGKSGWMGLADLTMGYDSSSAAKRPSTLPFLQEYARAAESIPGAKAVKPSILKAFHIPPASVVRGKHQIANILAALVKNSGLA